MPTCHQTAVVPNRVEDQRLKSTNIHKNCSLLRSHRQGLSRFEKYPVTSIKQWKHMKTNRIAWVNSCRVKKSLSGHCSWNLKAWKINQHNRSPTCDTCALHDTSLWQDSALHNTTHYQWNSHCLIDGWDQLAALLFSLLRSASGHCWPHLTQAWPIGSHHLHLWGLSEEFPAREAWPHPLQVPQATSPSSPAPSPQHKDL